MRYVIFVIDDSTEFANTDEMAAIDAFNDQMRADGHFVSVRLRCASARHVRA